MKQLIKDLPELSRPREKALKQGLNNLTDAELLAIIIKCGTKDRSALEISNQLLNDYHSLYEISNLSINKLASIKGIGTIKALTILSSIELGKRSTINDSKKIKINNADDIYKLYQNRYLNVFQEELFVIFLNNKNEIIHEEVIFKGSINQSMFHPREVFKKAIDYLAVKIILIHNHPSGDTTPSQADDFFTINMIKNGKMLGINIIDHIIIGKDYYSYQYHKPEIF